MTNQIQLVGTTEILGKEINFYGDWAFPYFLGKDVADWIDYAKTGNGTYDVSKMLKTIDEEEKATKIVRTLGGNQECWLLTEDGLYEVLMQSRKSIAKQLKKQIKTHLKQMRQTGGTCQVGREEEYINSIFPSLSEEVKQAMVLDMQRINREQQEEIIRQRQANAKLQGQLDTLVDSSTTFDDFKKVMNARVHAISRKTKVPIPDIWNTYYVFLLEGHSIGLSSRLSHTLENIDKEYFEKTGKHYAKSTLKGKATMLGMIRPDEYAMTLQIMKAFALDYEVDIEQVVKLALEEVDVENMEVA